MSEDTEKDYNQVIPVQFSIKRASIFYDIPEWTLRGYIKEHKFPVRRIGRKIYIVRERFEKWLGDQDEDFQNQREGEK